MTRRTIAILLVAIAAASALARSQSVAKRRIEGTLRIVSLSPAVTETLFAIGAGDEVVARTTECDYPSEVLSVPAIGGFDGKSISPEKIIALHPDLVCGASGMHDWLNTALQPLGITLYLSYSTSVSDVMAEITALGQMTNHTSHAQEVVASMKERLRNIGDGSSVDCTATPSGGKGTIRLPTARQPCTMYWEVWASPLMAVGGKSFMNDIIQHSGGVNIFADIQAAYPTVSEETVLRRNPAIIIVSQDAYRDKASAIKALQRRPCWTAMDAVKNERVILVGSSAVRPSPRVVDAIAALSAAQSEMY